MAEQNYQHDRKCPRCGKRKVFLQVTTNGAQFICKVDGYTWPAYIEISKVAFKKTTG